MGGGVQEKEGLMPRGESGSMMLCLGMLCLGLWVSWIGIHDLSRF